MSDHDIQLVAEKPSDEKFLRALYSTTRTDVKFSALPPEQKQQFINMQFDAQRYHYRTQFQNVDFWIVKQNGRSVGRLYLSETPEELRVIDISLVPECRRKGIGSRLLRSIQIDAGSRKLPVTLHAEKHGGTKPFYERLGFEVVEEKKTHYFMKWTKDTQVLI